MNAHTTAMRSGMAIICTTHRCDFAAAAREGLPVAAAANEVLAPACSKLLPGFAGCSLPVASSCCMLLIAVCRSLQLLTVLVTSAVGSNDKEEVEA
jgi:hypothetical protein